jgi:diguanylate cyclase (GGDEF)-like protein/PAS domain S-box-containing protein
VRWLQTFGTARHRGYADAGRSLAARAARDPGTVGLVLLMVAIMACYASRLGGTPAQVIMFWLVQPALDLLLFLIARDLARSPQMPPMMRRFWSALSFAGLIFTLGDAIQTVTAIRDPVPRASVAGTPQTICFVIGVGWITWVMLNYPLVARTHRERLRFWLDAATVLVAAAVFAWTVTVKPSLTIDHPSELVELLIANALMIAAAFAAAKLVLSGNAPVTRAAATPAIAGVVLQSVVTSLAAANLDSRYFNLMLGVRLLPSVLILIGPRLQQLQLRGDPATVVRRPGKRFSRLPYVMIASTYIMLFIALPSGLTARAWGVLVGVVVISVIVVARQLMAFTDNANLLEQLDASLRELRRHEERFRSLVQHSSDITTVATADGVFTYVSASVERVLGYTFDSAIGKPVLAFVHPEDRDELVRQVAEMLATPAASITYQARYLHADGSWRWLEVISTNLLHEPSVAGIVSNAREVTETRQLHDQLRYQASHDALTGLANRGLFTERLAAATVALTGAARRDDGPVTIMLIDLDDFKTINDTLGHHIGDAVLVAVAERMRACVRATDTPSRLGGDEFAVLLPGAGAEVAAMIAQRFLDLLGQPVQAHDQLVRVHASVGIAAEYTDDPDALLRSADSAMYAAKRTGKSRYVCAISEPASSA